MYHCAGSPTAVAAAEMKASLVSTSVSKTKHLNFNIFQTYLLIDWNFIKLDCHWFLILVTWSTKRKL